MELSIRFLGSLFRDKIQIEPTDTLQRLIDSCNDAVPPENQRWIIEDKYYTSRNGNVHILGLFAGSAGNLTRVIDLENVPLFIEDVRQALTICTYQYFGATEIEQPLYHYTYMCPELPPLPICGPCAVTCHNMKDCVTPFEGDSISVLRKPFVCSCRCNVHSACFWKDDDPYTGSLDLFLDALRALWVEEACVYESLLSEHAMKIKIIERKRAEEEMTASIKADVAHVKQFFDEANQRAARAVIPMKQWKEKLERITPEGILKELLHWFKHDFFTWVDTLPCSVCSGKTRHNGGTTPTPEEMNYGAHNVEMHYCERCNVNTRFPRYNDAVKLLSWRKGRCGEWVACFTLCAASLGYEVRYIHDHTDHVWTEVYSYDHSRWIMMDPCEEAYDTPYMYEEGWGKKLNYIFGFSMEEVLDVTRKYTKRFDELVRNKVSEAFLAKVLRAEDAVLRSKLGVERQQTIDRRRANDMVSTQNSVEPQTYVARQTGSEEWKKDRGENGK